MTRLLVVCLGGAFGSGARYLLSTWVARVAPSAFPAGTLAVNALGSFFIALVMHVGLSTEAISPMWRLGLTTGVMGGFTTYSTFNYETTELLREGATGLALANVAVTIAVCLVTGFLGLALGKWLAGR
ncbi:MAG: fluoride efflux transporter CrcB [Thermoanaerobaculia bacterium]|jgi:CrcB protein